MARRSAKKSTSSSRSAGPKTRSASSNPSGPVGGGISFAKFFVLILVILGVMYGPSLFKNGVTVSLPQRTTDYFLLKKVAQFNVNPVPGRTFFVTDVAGVAPNLLALTDSPGGQVLEYDFKGKFIRKWGKSGDGPKNFHEPSGITTDHKGKMYVLDTWNGAVKVFDVTGKMFKTIDLTHFGFFYGPRRIGWGGDSLLIPNGSNARLPRLSLTGELLSLWEGKDVVGVVSDAITDGKGHFYVTDDTPKKGCVRVFDESGKNIQTIRTGGAPTAMAFDSKGRLYVAGEYGPSVYDTDGKLLGVLAEESEVGKSLSYVGIDIVANDTILTCGGDLVTIYKIAPPKEKQ